MARSQQAFTLVELLIVVIILGILAGVVIPQLASPAREAAQSRFADNLRVFIDGAAIYYAKKNEYPADSSSGVWESDWDGFIPEQGFEAGTPIGGVWDTELNQMGVTSAIGVHFNGVGETQDDAYMAEVDALFDDGDLTTGGFRKLASDRYYYVLAQ